MVSKAEPKAGVSIRPSEIPPRLSAVSRGAVLGGGIKAFTLMELLIVTLALAAVALAVYGVLNSGIKIWRIVNQDIPEENVNIFLERLTPELKNSFNFTAVNFSGKSEEIEFATLVASQRLKFRSIGKIRYVYDSIDKVLKRSQYDYSNISLGDESKERVVLRNVDSFRFSYYIYDSQTKTYIWKDEKIGDGLPVAVRIELEIKNDEKTIGFTKTVGIPVSG